MDIIRGKDADQMADKLNLNYEFCEPAPPTAGTGGRSSREMGTPDYGFSSSPNNLIKNDPESMKDNVSVGEN